MLELLATLLLCWPYLREVYERVSLATTFLHTPKILFTENYPPGNMIEESTPSKSTVVEIEQAHDSGAESTSTPGSPEYDAIRDILEISQSEPVSLGWRTWLVVFISAFLA